MTDVTVTGVPHEYFAAMYRASEDPWHLAQRWYEKRKYALTLAALPARRYRRAFEPGCSIGVLSAGLADRCDELVSWDREPAAVRQADKRLSAHPGARAAVGIVPDQWPDGLFDLIVFSEILYYLGDEELARTATAASASLVPGGHLVAVHWRHPVPEHARSAQDAHAALHELTGLAPMASHEETDFLLEIFLRFQPGDGVDRQSAAARGSVAAMEGLV